MPESLFYQSCKLEACDIIKKETLTQLFSYEFWEISENTFFHRTPLVAASTSLMELFCENSERLVARKLHHRCSTGF